MKYIRISPNVEYSTDMDFFLENQILCIVDEEGTKFCSLIENTVSYTHLAVESMAFCCISTGEYGFPQQHAAEIAVATVLDYLNTTKYTTCLLYTSRCV